MARRGRLVWFVPLRNPASPGAAARRQSCTHDNIAYVRILSTDRSLTIDSDSDVLSYLDIGQATEVIDSRKATALPQIDVLSSVGLNYQLSMNYSGTPAGNSFNPSAYGDLYAYNNGWYYATSLAWANRSRVARYESYALKEWLDTGTYLRLGDAVSNPTALGESLQFAGVSWGTDRNLRPNDFSPVLPTLRNGNTLSGPLEVFINDNLQFQQTLQNGVYDLRNLPAQQGFNSYSVRTIDAQGNPVTVEREIYLPASLLPSGISAWRVDAGFQREDFFTSNASYGPGFVSAAYAKGLNDDLTISGQGLVSKAASTLSAGVDQRLNSTWTGHLGLISAVNTLQQGSAVQARLDGGGRWWRLLADWTHAFRPLPGLGIRNALQTQRLLQAQWTGITNWSFGLTVVQSKREQEVQEEVATVSAATRVADSGASVNIGVTQTRSASGKQQNIMVSLFVPLAQEAGNRNRSLYASQNNAEGVSLTRAQYTDSGQTPKDGTWSVGATRDARETLSAIDAFWSGSTNRMDIMASGRAGQNDSNAQVSLRSGLLWTGGTLFSTRPITGAFAMVSTGEPNVSVFYENRPAGSTDDKGMLLVSELRPLESNRLTVDPTSWPIQWTASEVERRVIPPRGGGVLVSFKINAGVWPSESLVTPLQSGGQLFPAGSVARATVDGEVHEAVVNRQGELWIGELLPARSFTLSYAGKRCEFTLPAADNSTANIRLAPQQCQDSP